MASGNGNDGNDRPSRAWSEGEHSRDDCARPTVYWADHLLCIVLALGVGLAGGAYFDRVLLGDAVPWFPAAEATAIDGDTVKVSVLLHLDGVDAAEIDRERCPGERAVGLRARDRANELLNAGPVRVKILGEDEHGRMGAQITAADRPISAVLLRENLLQPGDAGHWCPDDANGTQDGPDTVQRMMAALGLR